MAQTGYTPLLIYSSSTVSQAPAAGNLTNSTLGSELAINITDGKLFYKDNANAVQVIAWKTTPTTAGGTGLTSYTAGDLLYYASGTALTKLAIGATGRWLGSSGTAPQWNAPAALTKTDDTNVTLTLGGSASTALLNAASLTLGWTGQLAVSRGGTGLSGLTANRILYASATDTVGTSSGFTFDGAGAFRSAGSTNGFLSSGTFVNSSNGTSAVNRIQIGNDSSDGAGQIVVYGSQHSTLSNIMDINNANTAALRFLTNNTERARITSGGDFCIGDTAVSAGAERVVIKSAGTSSATAGIKIINSAGTELFFIRSDGAFRTGSAAVSPYNNTTATAANVWINTDGTLLRSTSSLKYKTDVKDATYGLADVLKLRAVTYKSKSEIDGQTVYGGLIAEEVHDAGLTQFVEYAPDGAPDALRYANMASLFVNAIKELTARIEELEKK